MPADSLGDELDSLSDPTIRLALALGLDPLQLPMCGGPGIRSTSPAAGKPAPPLLFSLPLVSLTCASSLARSAPSSGSKDACSARRAA